MEHEGGDRRLGIHHESLSEADADALGLQEPPQCHLVRELQHAIERAVLVARTREVTVGDLPEALQHGSADGDEGSIAPSEVPSGSLEDIERASILKALDATRWNKQAAAALLGLRRPTLYSKMRKHNIPQRRN